MVNGIVSFISFSDLSLLVYRDARDFCALILYPAALPDAWISTSGFLVASLGFSMYSIMLSANTDSLTSFSIWISFISLSSLIAMASLENPRDGGAWWAAVYGVTQSRTRLKRLSSSSSSTSRTMLNNSGENGHPCFVTGLGGSAFSLLPVRATLSWSCHEAFITWGNFPLCPLSEEFLLQMVIDFCQKAFLHLLSWSSGFYSSVCIPGVNLTRSWCVSL